MGNEPSSPAPSEASALQFKEHNLRILEQIGEGSFSLVYKVEELGSGRQLALKKACVASEHLKEAEAEAAYMQACGGHPHLMGIEDWLSFPAGGRSGQREVAFLMPLCAPHTLLDVINTQLKDLPQRTEAAVLAIYSHVASGVRHMHTLDPPLIHRDIKPTNVFQCASTQNWVLGDLGSTQQGVRTVTRREDVLREEDEIARMTTLEYRAPEQKDLWQFPVVLGPAVDVWAMGILLFQMCFQFNEQQILAVLRGREPLPSEPRLTPSSAALLLALMNKEHSRRPPMPYVCATLEAVLRGEDPGVVSEYRNTIQAHRPSVKAVVRVKADTSSKHRRTLSVGRISPSSPRSRKTSVEKKAPQTTLPAAVEKPSAPGVAEGMLSLIHISEPTRPY
eukprot:TRINITY_DN50114_c0_g1_i2.p1 TRINITY_DN50114_c0_g1~~TRINITY_DN50114_c0_g1_i2.p1  ORF type:complete len:392 (+),score=103.09 TRINITY_DN50114_c0_g1_i2:182-1357(+)